MSVASVEADMVGSGGIFELVDEKVLGETIKVFKDRNRSLREVLDSSKNHGDNIYIVCDGRRISYSEHLELVKKVAHNLTTKYGVKHGDRIAILADNHPEWLITFWATISLGAVCVALNGWWSKKEILYGLENSDPILLVGDKKRLARLEGVEFDFPIITIEENFSDLTSTDMDSLALSENPIAEDDPALILYTSGTTGKSKGAVLSHRGLVAFVSSAFFNGFRTMMLAAEKENPPESTPPSCGLHTAPLFHLSGLFSGGITSLAAGLKTVWTTGRFDPVKVLTLIETEKVNIWAALGSMASKVLDHPDFDQFDVSSISIIGSGGAPISVYQQQRIQNGFSGSRGSMAMGYGLTESTGIGAQNWGEYIDLYPKSAGRAFPGMGITIRDEEGNELPEGAEGEICIQGASIMLEYWRNPEATAKTIGSGRILKTGDMGRMEGEYLYINSRARDLILRNAENIYPVEIEHCLERHDFVKEAAVIGVDHAELGQEVKAILVTGIEMTEDEKAVRIEELTGFCKESLSAFKIPSLWEFRESALPRIAAGKILKNVLSGEVELSLIEE